MTTWEVGEVHYDYDESCEEIILKTFMFKNNAIEYIVKLCIDNLLEHNNFSNKCNYYYRSCGYYTIEWTKYTISELQNYIKYKEVYNKEQIMKYFNDRQKYIANKEKLNETYRVNAELRK